MNLRYLPIYIIITMGNLMPYKLAAVEPKQIVLSELDETGETYVIIRPATGRDQLMYEQIAMQPTYSYKVDKFGPVNEKMPMLPYMEQAAKTWRVLEECNIEDAEGKPVLQKEMKWEDWQTAWAKLPAHVRDLLFEAVLEVNPNWGN